MIHDTKMNHLYSLLLNEGSVFRGLRVLKTCLFLFGVVLWLRSLDEDVLSVTAATNVEACRVGDCFTPNPLDLAAVQSVLARSNIDFNHLVPEGSLVLDSSVSPSPEDPLITATRERESILYNRSRFLALSY